ncbi:unnamed protein product [Periconia digitata]|uniref:Uncharacterized protein n=1 Tax=Periconia digitata TaxID=1303443 RepID=A0A9W4XY64_9PLEO|nr:unnamed protein product [Periconia digitata]
MANSMSARMRNAQARIAQPKPTLPISRFTTIGKTIPPMGAPDAAMATAIGLRR